MYRHTYVCVLHVYHGEYTLKNGVFKKETQQNGFASVYMDEPWPIMYSGGILDYNMWLQNFLNIDSWKFNKSMVKCT
jgi:hypothetical protein